MGGVKGRVVRTPTSTLLLAHRLLSTAGVELEPQETLVALTETDPEGQRLRAVVKEEVSILHDLTTGVVVTHDLSQDPGETRPVVLEATQAQRVLEELFAASAPGPAPVPWGGTPERQEALEALGYVE